MSDKRRVLIVDDDRGHAETLAEVVEAEGYACSLAFSGAEGAEAVEKEDFDLVITDLVMHDLSGIDLLRKAKAKSPDTEVLVITGYASEDTAIEALNEGATDYVAKPFNLPILRVKIRRALDRQDLVRSNRELRSQLDKKFGFEGIVGNGEAMQRVFDVLPQVSRTTATVLIVGESGTGKELVARAIHANSPRRGKHFVPLNCAALSESILESELFGHEKGAFTGAMYTRKGRFEYAHGGTLFLDEIGDMPAEIQIKLLRVIEYGEVFRVGSNEPIKVDVRLIAATNRDLGQLVRDGRFREDLYFRLKVVTVALPPLRERLEDLPVLADHFIREFSARHGKDVRGISPEALRTFYEHSWKGNIRELRNVVESMVVMARGGTLGVEDVPGFIRNPDEAPLPDAGALGGVNLKKTEIDLIQKALEDAGGNREQAAKMLGISERTLYRKIKRYGLAERETDGGLSH
ncbi:MAG: sigma-54-dependent Fis family transcriptional regulator [Planctomycetes bacterium]|nr:sigma-54-dependent Fis family transcriptional regulator [Planctomycetota bacterium]